MAQIAMHGHGVRGMKPETLHSFDGIGDPGKFGIMFPNLLPFSASDDALAALAKSMADKLLDDGNPEPATPILASSSTMISRSTRRLSTSSMPTRRRPPTSGHRRSISIRSTAMGRVSIPIFTNATSKRCKPPANC